MKLIKYVFNDKEQADSKIASLYDEEGNKSVNFTSISLGKFVLSKGEYDNECNVVKEPILSDGYAVDILWYDFEESPYGWKTYEVNPTVTKHTIYGWDN